ncbi:hypothetical protein [Parapedobacter sp. 10938]|uniref:hypothetical protein n=1 Tax=Parapedobacter flavus TaxID=3110225 RepID=UPI002DBD23A2|nr:hypothetical protein [Parapedobacter sp. 10938]MEC3878284.1 hypothetical protein [Parapedobacter sp. 10938]
MRALLTQFVLLAGIFTTQSNPLANIQSLQDSTRAKSVYVEYGGPSAIYSVNYDTRFMRSNNGWGLRAGIGFLPSQGINNISVPIQVNYLLGRTRHFFEAGAGATYFHGDRSDSWFGPSEAGSMVFGSLSAGYRYQPLSRGVTARIGITGIAGSFNNNSVAALPHISVGYRF